MEECKICKEYVADDINSVKLTKKGKNGVNKKSREIGDDIKLETGDKVHKDCRKNLKLVLIAHLIFVLNVLFVET